MSEFPVLSGAILHQNTIFTAKDFIDRIVKKEESDNGSADENETESNEHKEPERKRLQLWPRTQTADPEPSRESLAIIRHAVSKQGTPEDEHFFFRREMAFRARIDGFRVRLPYRVFGVFSEFGYSIQRPVLSLMGLFLLFGVLFSAASVSGNWPIDSRDLWIKGVVAPFGLSFANIFAFFGFHRLYAPDILERAPWWLLVLSGVQTVLGFILLFFLGLGLRTRFRLR